MKFKVGDKVKATTDLDEHVVAGSVGVVMRVYDDSLYPVQVSFEDDPTRDKLDWQVHHYEIAHVDEKE